MKFLETTLTFVTAMFFVSISALSQEKVSDQELTNFANAFTNIQVVNQNAQTEMVKVIEESGMQVETFNLLYQAAQSPTPVEPEGVSTEDTEKFEVVVAKIEQMQPKFQKQMEDAIFENDLSVERYQQMMAMIQTDEELQQKLQSKLQ